MMVALNYLSFQSMLHNWCDKGHSIYYPVCWMVHTKSHTANRKEHLNKVMAVGFLSHNLSGP